MSEGSGRRAMQSDATLSLHAMSSATGIRCVALFTCTSPWESHDYGIQQKIMSPLSEEYFYKREFDRRATTAINLDDEFNVVVGRRKVPATRVRSF
jgi:hypothetical protein